MKDLFAALLYFTRLPLGFLPTRPENYKNVVSYWALTGLLTGGIMAGTLWVAAAFFPVPIAVILAVCSRLILTGAFHEDGLADFFDGFGGGRDREGILRIMKDSHIGSYGTLGLILYFLLLVGTLSFITPQRAVIVILIGDPLSKLIASSIVQVLPYARPEEESKIKMSYSPLKPVPSIAATIIIALLFYFLIPEKYYYTPALPVILFLVLINFFQRKIKGYTGDCCGATFLLCELFFYLSFLFYGN